MKTKLSQAIVFSFLGLALALHAEAAKGVLDGQIFIVTQDAENVKLGLVKVNIFSEEEITNYVANRFKSAPNEMPKYGEMIQHTDDTIKEMKGPLQQLESAQAVYSNKVDENVLKTGGTGVGQGKGTITVLENIKDDLIQRKRNWPDASYFFKNLPEATFSSLTDADGEFKILLPSQGKFAISAQSSRKVPTRTENYYWLLWVSLDGKAESRMLLSNHNLMTSGSKESVVSTKY